MKQFRIFTLLTISILLLSSFGNAQNNQLETKTSKNKIEVLGFHSTHRCMTCNAIEKNTKYTLDTYFAKELKDGIITFQSINVDEKKNYLLAEKYEASGTSLFLNVIINEKEDIHNLTTLAFAKGKDKISFSSALKKEIDLQLSKLNNYQQNN